ncbi:retron St85 family effector protein [Microvirga sp. VF16]|uniref:retron St85 family effector protein n=1 Tax=Microvirga sp. VF16 TaxID=2807101 RepID=UPI00193E6ACD|nr:retron St85 family effector protein [Microvirga sp. VF16]QRM27899.1 retron St85 family effector protein [Microvirga sp. VF16]
MPDELAILYNDINQDKLRVTRPSKLVFLCGGVISSVPHSKAISLRDYLFRIRGIEKKLKGPIVLAEKANQLYRETNYGDLISFEEDIARIAAVVLVIAESPGSLAELGAFATNNTIARALRIVMQAQYANTESFIRFGPVERIKRVERSFVGFYPWRINQRGVVVTGSAAPHYGEIVKFINQHIDKTPASELFRNLGDAKQFYVTYWVIYLAMAVSQTVLHGYMALLYPTLTASDLRNRLYCMELAGWISKESYSGKDYYYTLSSADPFDYAYKDSVREKDSIRRKHKITAAMQKIEAAPNHVRTVVVRKRGGSR